MIFISLSLNLIGQQVLRFGLIDDHILYDQVEIKRSQYKEDLTGKLKKYYKELPNKIVYFKQNEDKLSEHNKVFIKDCQVKMSKVKQEFLAINNNEFDEDLFAKYWKDELQDCFGLYNKLAPIIFYNFNTSSIPTDEEFIITDVIVTVYFGAIFLSLNDRYFVHGSTERETIRFNSQSDYFGANQKIPLTMKPALTKNQKFTMELRLIDQEYWTGSFQSKPLLIQISFLGTQGTTEKIIDAEPFAIDLL